MSMRNLLRATVFATSLMTLSGALLAPAVAEVVFNRGNSADPESLDPHKTSTIYEAHILRDMFEGSRIGQEMSRMAAIMALAPLVAPLIGGVLETAFGWRSNFIALFGFGATGFVMIWFLLPETLRQRAPEPVSPSSTLRSYRRLLDNPSFVAHLGIVACCMSGLFAWISASAFILQDIYGVSAMAFGISFAVS